ncbi:MAG: hypothetical protein EBS55_05690 [Flavobacteriaceae bacterium]|nr:hypothetical protein [Flavobacteriaceae bacterium]
MENLKKIQSWFKSLTKVKQILLVIGLVILLAIANKNKSSSSIDSDNSITTIEGTKKCLVNYDWTYPTKSNPISAWKFLTDGTFNYSTTAFNGMSAWGNWVIVNPGEINISYTKTSQGVLPSDQVLSISSCNSLNVGSTVYSKD